MSQHQLREIEKLKQRILGLASAAEDAFLKAVRATHERDRELAQEVIDGDFAIDQMEIEVEEECLKLLALYQPVAIDLRFIVAVLKINSDLERVGDLAVNIAERAVYLASEEELDFPFDFPAMARATSTMLKRSLDALVDSDVEAAREVCAADDEVDRMNREVYTQIKDLLRRRPQAVDRLVHYLGIARHLERIADHATNIAEDILYMVEGEIARHTPEDYRSHR